MSRTLLLGSISARRRHTRTCPARADAAFRHSRTSLPGFGHSIRSSRTQVRPCRHRSVRWCQSGRRSYQLRSCAVLGRIEASRIEKPFLVPLPSGKRDGLQIRFLRRPWQQGWSELRIRIQCGRVAHPARTFDDRNSPATRGFYRRYDLADRVPMASPQIYAGALPAGEKPIERFDMGGREIGNMDIISHSRAVARVVIDAINLNGGFPALRCSDNKRNEVGLRYVILADLAIGIGPRGVEIAQAHIADAVSPTVPG